MGVEGGFHKLTEHCKLLDRTKEMGIMREGQHHKEH